MSRICPEMGVRCACGLAVPTLRARVPRRTQAGSLLVCEVPATRWAPGAEEAGASVDRSRTTTRRLLHEAAGGGPVAGDARGGFARDVGWARAHRGLVL